MKNSKIFHRWEQMNSINQFNNQMLLSQFKERKANGQAPHYSQQHFTSNSNDTTSSSATSQKSKTSKKKIAFYSIAALSAATLAFIGLKNGAPKMDMNQRFQINQSDFEKLRNVANTTLGENYVDSLMSKAKWSDASQIKPNSLIKDLKDTLIDIPGLLVDGYNGLAKKLNKNYTPKGIFASRALHNEQAIAKDAMLNLVEVFKKVNYDENAFTSKVAKNIASNSISYKTRNERTLTRLTTGLVSTIFTGTDFYNISILQKDDKKEAKQSAQTREKQEFSRYAMNAIFQFISLGAFDKYTKNSIPLTVLVSGATSLFTEVTSRLFTHTPLTPLTPEQAKHIAEKRRAKEAKKNNQEVKANKENKQQNQPSFKANLNNQIVFKDFAKTDGSFASLNLQRENIKNQNQNQEQIQQQEAKPKKKSKLGKILGLCFAGFSAFYIFSRTSKGSEVLKNISETLKLADIKKALTTKKRYIDPDELIGKIDSVLKDDTVKTADGRKILEKYRNVLTGDENTSGAIGKIEVEDGRLILGSIYSGFAKMGNTISAIFSLPGKLLCDGYKSLSKKFAPTKNVVNNGLSTIEVADRFKECGDRLGEISAFYNNNKSRVPAERHELMITGNDIGNGGYSFKQAPAEVVKYAYPKEYNDGVEALDKLFKKYGNNHKKLLEEITKRARNTKANGGTSIVDVAHNCRTIATAISTYFFVNDYRNKVLIESDGKDIDGAREQTNERIIHKLANFLINGTLMNLFNSTFKPIMNASIIAASGVSALTEFCNESLVRFSICSPKTRMGSRQELLDFNEKQEKQGGLKGAYVRAFKKLTGKKNIVEKSGVNAK